MNHTHSSIHPIPILYQDDQYVVVNKPAGLVVIPTPLGEKRTLVSEVNEQCREKSAGQGLHPCHRLDRDTTGAIIFAWGKQNQRLMMDIFKEQCVDKQYLAFVQGKMPQRTGIFKSVIRSLEDRRHGVHAAGQFAETHYRVSAQYPAFCAVEVIIKTGRSNQIRIHFAEAGHPLVGERKYARGKDFSLRFRRTALHAATVSFVNPVTKKTVSVTAPLPDDMQKFLEKYGTVK